MNVCDVEVMPSGLLWQYQRHCGLWVFSDIPTATSGKTRQFSNLYLEGCHFTIYILYPSELAQHSYLPTYRYLPGPTKATTGVFDFFFLILFNFFSF